MIQKWIDGLHLLQGSHPVAVLREITREEISQRRNVPDSRRDVLKVTELPHGMSHP